MSDLIERMAKVAFDAGTKGMVWDDESDAHQEYWRGLIRAAWWEIRHPTLEQRECLEGKTGTDFIKGWQDMIDKGLEP